MPRISPPRSRLVPLGELDVLAQPGDVLGEVGYLLLQRLHACLNVDRHACLPLYASRRSASSRSDSSASLIRMASRARLARATNSAALSAAAALAAARSASVTQPN